MKGYHSIGQFVDDFRLYMAARKVDPGREDGETMSSFIRKRIYLRLKNSSKRFKALLKRNSYTVDDLELIATHDSLRRIECIDDFLMEVYDTNFVRDMMYKRLLSSSAFRKGRLRMLESFVPRRISSKTELLRFIKSRHGISRMEFGMIMRLVGKKQWKVWVDELIREGALYEGEGELY